MHAGCETAAGYHCEAASVAGFIQQLAVGFIARGYWFYVTGFIPAEKDARAVDEKLIRRYGVACSKWVRHRRKRRGEGNIQYLRFRRFFVLLATPGEHEFFRKEARIKDIRRMPIHCFGYCIGCYKGDSEWHPSVRIERSLFGELKRDFQEAALLETGEALRERFRQLCFEPYAPVRRQLAHLLQTVNHLRRTAGEELVSNDALRLKRRVLKPFQECCTAPTVPGLRPPT